MTGLSAHLAGRTAASKRRRELPEVCSHCGEWIEYVRDPDGLWAECACDCGYID